ncbi:MAG TPA: response regulator transcription factor [Bacteroidia bacterium]|nr:response regulator transcription factor [Bacteroidia bacterium]
MKHTAIVADDHPIFRKGLIEILGGISELEIVAELSDGMQAYQSILAKRPDLAILDIEMPGLTGLDICRKVMSEKSETRFIVLTMHRDKNFFNDAMNIGVMGYLLKDHAISELIKCVEQVLKGEKFVSPGIKNLLAAAEENDLPELAQLTPTEKVILKLIAETKTSAEIAQLLFVSPNTIDNHRSNMVKKLGLEGKNSILKFAIQHKHLL